MPDQDHKPRTAATNSRLWGARARDWADIQEGQCRPAYLAAFERVKLGPDSMYLDAGCGSGMASQIAANLGAKISGLDAATSLIDIAKERVPNGDFQVGELETLPFADDSFDFVTGFNSIQYAGNPSTALAEAKRVTKPGGHALIMTWGTPEGMEAAALIAAIKPLLPPPPPGTPGPFSLSEETTLREFAKSGGLKTIEVFDVPSDWHYPNQETALRGLKSAGVAVRAIEHASESAVDSAYAAALEPFKRADGSYRIGASFRCVLTQA